MSRLSIAFPEMSKEFFILLAEFVIKHNFTAKRLSDAVDYVITNFPYKRLNIADIIRFDKREKFYTYNEMCTIVHKEGISTSCFEMQEIDGKKLWRRK